MNRNGRNVIFGLAYAATVSTILYSTSHPIGSASVESYNENGISSISYRDKFFSFHSNIEVDHAAAEKFAELQKQVKAYEKSADSVDKVLSSELASYADSVKKSQSR